MSIISSDSGFVEADWVDLGKDKSPPPPVPNKVEEVTSPTPITNWLQRIAEKQPPPPVPVAPPLPRKPAFFHMQQLEKLLKGEISPTGLPIDEVHIRSIMLQLSYGRGDGKENRVTKLPWIVSRSKSQ